MRGLDGVGVVTRRTRGALGIRLEDEQEINNSAQDPTLAENNLFVDDSGYIDKRYPNRSHSQKKKGSENNNNNTNNTTNNKGIDSQNSEIIDTTDTVAKDKDVNLIIESENFNSNQNANENSNENEPISKPTTIMKSNDNMDVERKTATTEDSSSSISNCPETSQVSFVQIAGTERTKTTSQLNVTGTALTETAEMIETQPPLTNINIDAKTGDGILTTKETGVANEASIDTKTLSPIITEKEMSSVVTSNLMVKSPNLNDEQVTSTEPVTLIDNIQGNETINTQGTIINPLEEIRKEEIQSNASASNSQNEDINSTLFSQGSSNKDNQFTSQGTILDE